MELHGNDYVYEVTPPFLGQQRLLLQKSMETLKQMTDEGVPDPVASAREKIESEDTSIRIGLVGISMVEMDKIDAATIAAYADYTKDKAAELVQGKTFEMIRSKVKYIKNLTVDGKPVETFAEAYQLACCADLVKWIQGVIYSTAALTAAERKNFLPE